MRLVTWNINSIRARLPLVEQLSKSHAPDVLCLQETKVEDSQFPHREIAALGYGYRAVKGQKSYHGVAILSKLPLDEVTTHDWCAQGDARYIAATLSLGVEGMGGVGVDGAGDGSVGAQRLRLHNFYVPAGGDVPDPVVNDKFAHKLRFLAAMREWAGSLPPGQMVVGDFNVAPYEEDVWDHKALLRVVSHTPVECEALLAVYDAHDFVDVVRAHHPRPERLYSWWSYRARDWSASDRGRRLDHVWMSADAAARVRSVLVDRAARGWAKPSDHAPIVVDLF